MSEASVMIAVSAEHRKEAIDAVAYAIDQVKSTVAIWKKVSDTPAHYMYTINIFVLEPHHLINGIKKIQDLECKLCGGRSDIKC